jgi:hypothetical protein
MNFDESSLFSKELKRLARKYKSLHKDLEEFKQVIAAVPLGTSKHFNVLTKTEQCVIVKARLFCRYLKGSALRIVYAYKEEHTLIEFIEVYFKGDKENEDQDRIREYLEAQ